MARSLSDLPPPFVDRARILVGAGYLTHVTLCVIIRARRQTDEFIANCIINKRIDFLQRVL